MLIVADLHFVAYGGVASISNSDSVYSPTKIIFPTKNQYLNFFYICYLCKDSLLYRVVFPLLHLSHDGF